MSMYQNSGDLSYSDVDDLAEFFAIYGYPAGIFNRYAYVNNTSAAECADNLIELAKEAEEELPPTTFMTTSCVPPVLNFPENNTKSKQERLSRYLLKYPSPEQYRIPRN